MNMIKSIVERRRSRKKKKKKKKRDKKLTIQKFCIWLLLCMPLNAKCICTYIFNAFCFFFCNFSIHPRDKLDVARRLALAGRAVAYNESNLAYQGPLPTSFIVGNDSLTIRFGHRNDGSAIEVRDTARGFDVSRIKTHELPELIKCSEIMTSDLPFRKCELIESPSLHV